MAKRIENPPAPVEAEIVPPPMGEIKEPEGSTPGERINYHVGMAQHHGRQALAHLIMAGWELARQKAAIGYGGWVEWCGANLQISRHTADRYIQFYQKTVGAARNEAGIPLAKKPTVRELSAATVGMEQKSATRAMVDLDIIRRPDNWGGANRGQGRKAKGAAEVAEEEMVELDKIAETPAAAWATVRDHLRPLQDAQRDRHVFDHLDLVELAEAHNILRSLCSDAEAALKRFEKV